MKVKQLIKKLQKINQDAEIILASDAEGNNYSVLDEILSNLYFCQDDGGIDLYTPDEREEENFNADPCIVLYPR